MTPWTEDEQAAVIAVIMRSWPGGVANRGWELKTLGGYVAELQERNLTAHWAIKGLRASLSAFIPSAGEVLALAREAMPPLTAVEIDALQRQHLERRRAEAKIVAVAELDAG